MSSDLIASTRPGSLTSLALLRAAVPASSMTAPGTRTVRFVGPLLLPPAWPGSITCTRDEISVGEPFESRSCASTVLSLVPGAAAA